MAEIRKTNTPILAIKCRGRSTCFPPPETEENQGEGERQRVLEPEGAQTNAGNVLVFLGGQAAHANTTHDRARLGM